MNFGSQIRWIDGNNKIHVGTVVADHGNNMWGVTHVLNPDRNSFPEYTVAMQGGQWRTVAQSSASGGQQPHIGAGQWMYTNPGMRQTGRYQPAPVPTTQQPVGLGQIMYREAFNKMRLVK